MGEYLADKVARNMRLGDIDVVMPIPDSSRPAAMQLAARLGLDYREGLIKNRYVGRTFIMPGQAVRRKSVRQKLNAIGMEFKGKNVLLVDDSIVRGTTSREIVDMARAAGANKVYFASAAPPVRFPNVYGIDMPTQQELIATGRSDEEIARTIGADALVYQDLHDMQQAVRDVNPALSRFEASCFDGEYVTGDITAEYLARLGQSRGKPAMANRPAACSSTWGTRPTTPERRALLVEKPSRRDGFSFWRAGGGAGRSFQPAGSHSACRVASRCVRYSRRSNSYW